MERIGEAWNKIVAVATDEVRQVLHQESYILHKLSHITVHDRKRRVIDYACDKDKELFTPVHKIIAPLLTKKIAPESYSSMKGRGQMECAKRVSRLVKKYGSGYYVKVDIRKYYPSIDHDLLKSDLRQYIKDKALLRFLDTVIDHHSPGIPIGLSISALLANLYLSRMIRETQEVMRIDTVAYMDDLLFFFHTKDEANAFIPRLEKMLQERKLTPHEGIHAAPVDKGVWFIGYVFYKTHIRLRKNIRERMKKRHRELEQQRVDDAIYKRKMAPYFGWCIHANCIHLLKKTMGKRYKLFGANVMKYKKLQDKKAEKNWFGLSKDVRESINDLVGKELVIFESLEVEIYKERKAAVRYCYPEEEDKKHYFLTRSEVMMDRLQKDKEEWPAVVTITEKTGKNGRKYFCYE